MTIQLEEMGLNEGRRRDGRETVAEAFLCESPSRPFEIPSGGDFLSPTILRKRPVGYVQIALSLVTWSTVLFSLRASLFVTRLLRNRGGHETCRYEMFREIPLGIDIETEYPSTIFSPFFSEELCRKRYLLSSRISRH